MEILGLSIGSIDRASAVAIFAIMALLVITDKLVWHTRLKASEARADRWEAVALEALRTGAASGVKAAEVAVSVVSAIPDPQGDRDRRSAEGAVGP